MLNNYLSIDIRMVNDKLSSLASFGTLSSNDAGFWTYFSLFGMFHFTILSKMKFDWALCNIHNGYKTIYDDFNIMWILTVKYDTPFKNKNKSWEKPDRNGVYLFKVSFGNMTRDASFLKIMLISGLTVMIVLVVYTKINLQQPIVTCNRIHNFGIW